MAVNYKPEDTLRCKPLREGLKRYIVPQVVAKYNIVSLRAVWTLERLAVDASIWEKRRELEVILLAQDEIVAFFSCITALSQRKPPKKRKRKEENDSSEESEEEDNESKIPLPGLSFWIVCDWPEYGIKKLEGTISKLFQEAGLNIERCKAITSRGK